MYSNIDEADEAYHEGYIIGIEEGYDKGFIAGCDSVVDESKHQLWTWCKTFIKQQRISSPESIYQMDNVSEHSPEFIKGVCDIVGYEVEDDEITSEGN